MSSPDKISSHSLSTVFKLSTLSKESWLKVYCYLSEYVPNFNSVSPALLAQCFPWCFLRDRCLQACCTGLWNWAALTVWGWVTYKHILPKRLQKLFNFLLGLSRWLIRTLTQGFWSASNSEQKEFTVMASFEILAPIMCEG